MTASQAEDIGARIGTDPASEVMPAMPSVSHRRLAIAVLVYIGCAALLFPQTFLHFGAVKLRLLLTAFSFVAVTVLALALARAPAAPLSFVRWFARERAKTVVLTLFAFVFGLAAFSTIKFNIPNVVPFYADAFLADLDEALFGIAPWQWAHAVIPPRWSGFVDLVYSRFWFLGVICCVTFVALTADAANFKRFMWSTFAIYAGLGSLLALVFSCVGPIFYDDFHPGQRFSALTQRLAADPGIVYVTEYANYLLWSHRNNVAQLGAGISAMPSVHVAYAVLTAWLLTSYHRWLAVPGWAYAAFIAVGSVYTGWHYALDGVVSFVVVTAIWVGLSRRYRLRLVPRRSPSAD